MLGVAHKYVVGDIVWYRGYSSDEWAMVKVVGVNQIGFEPTYAIRFLEDGERRPIAFDYQLSRL